MNPALAHYIILVNEAPTIVSFSDLAIANDAETMEEIANLMPGESTILGQCDPITRLREDGTVEAIALIVFPARREWDLYRLRLATGPFAGMEWSITSFPGHLSVVDGLYRLTFDPRPLVTG